MSTYVVVLTMHSWMRWAALALGAAATVNAFVGRSDHGPDDRTSHAVLAPVFWDFASTKGRATVGVPF